MIASIQVFCRSVVVCVFVLSFASKVRNVPAFRQSITNFALLPAQLSHLAAPLFLLAEALIVVLVALAGPFLLPGYILAAGLLLLFCIALLSVLIRRISTTCSCFGLTTTPVSSIDLVRNIGFIACVLGGCLTISWPGHAGNPDLATWGLGGLGALVFVATWTQLGEIVRIFR